MFIVIKAGGVVTLTNTGDGPRVVRSDCGAPRSEIDTDESIFVTVVVE